MYRTRGKPDDPLNIKVAQQHKLLSEAIQINSLNTFISETVEQKQKELQRRRHHFDEFRETYQERLKKYQKKTWPGQFVTNEHKPVFIKAPLKPVRTVTVEIPLIAQQNAVWCPGKSNSDGMACIKKTRQNNNNKIASKETCEILRKLNEIEKKIERKDDSVQAEVFKEIQEVNEEINIAELQLKQIHSLIENKKQATSQTKSNDTMKPKKSSTTWMVEHGTRNDKNELTGAKRLVNTLSVLNQRLQKIQNKFQSKSAYKSIKDYLSNRKSLEVIYENSNFKAKPKMKELETDLKHHYSPQKSIKKSAISQTISIPKLEVQKPKLPSPRKIETTDVMSEYFQKDLLNDIMKSQFLLKEFREEKKVQQENCSGVNAVFTSADLMRS